jgi:hypothetical protein
MKIEDIRAHAAKEAATLVTLLSEHFKPGEPFTAGDALRVHEVRVMVARLMGRSVSELNSKSAGRWLANAGLPGVVLTRKKRQTYYCLPVVEVPAFLRDDFTPINREPKRTRAPKPPDANTLRQLAILAQLEDGAPGRGWCLEYVQRCEKYMHRPMCQTDIGRAPSAFPALPDAPRDWNPRAEPLLGDNRHFKMMDAMGPSPERSGTARPDYYGGTDTAPIRLRDDPFKF